MNIIRKGSAMIRPCFNMIRSNILSKGSGFKINMPQMGNMTRLITRILNSNPVRKVSLNNDYRVLLLLGTTLTGATTGLGWVSYRAVQAKIAQNRIKNLELNTTLTFPETPAEPILVSQEFQPTTAPSLIPLQPKRDALSDKIPYKKMISRDPFQTSVDKLPAAKKI